MGLVSYLPCHVKNCSDISWHRLNLNQSKTNCPKNLNSDGLIVREMGPWPECIFRSLLQFLVTHQLRKDVMYMTSRMVINIAIFVRKLGSHRKWLDILMLYTVAQTSLRHMSHLINQLRNVPNFMVTHRSFLDTRLWKNRSLDSVRLHIFVNTITWRSQKPLIVAGSLVLIIPDYGCQGQIITVFFARTIYWIRIYPVPIEYDPRDHTNRYL